MVYDKIIPEVLELYRSSRVPNDNEAEKIEGKIYANAKGMRDLVQYLRRKLVFYHYFLDDVANLH